MAARDGGILNAGSGEIPNQRLMTRWRNAETKVSRVLRGDGNTGA